MIEALCYRKITPWIIFKSTCKDKHKKVLRASSHSAMCHSVLEQGELRQRRYLLSPIYSLFSGCGRKWGVLHPSTDWRKRNCSSLPEDSRVLHYTKEILISVIQHRSDSFRKRKIFSRAAKLKIKTKIKKKFL